jgi:hypothetical protein
VIELDHGISVKSTNNLEYGSASHSIGRNLFWRDAIARGRVVYVAVTERSVGVIHQSFGSVSHGHERLEAQVTLIDRTILSGVLDRNWVGPERNVERSRSFSNRTNIVEIVVVCRCG